MNDTTTAERTCTQAELEGRIEAQVAYALRQYKEQVLAAAIEARDENGWCSDGFAAAMRGLDIEVPAERYTVTFDLKVQFDIELDGAMSADKAGEYIEQTLAENLDFQLEPKLMYSDERVNYIYSASIEGCELDGFETS